MSKADEMFEKLGYKKEYEAEVEEVSGEEMRIKYSNEFYNYYIQFWNDKTVNKKVDFDEIGYLNMQELQAINLKCKELGWVDENINETKE